MEIYLCDDEPDTEIPVDTPVEVDPTKSKRAEPIPEPSIENETDFK